MHGVDAPTLGSLMHVGVPWSVIDCMPRWKMAMRIAKAPLIDQPCAIVKNKAGRKKRSSGNGRRIEIRGIDFPFIREGTSNEAGHDITTQKLEAIFFRVTKNAFVYE